MDPDAGRAGQSGMRWSTGRRWLWLTFGMAFVVWNAVYDVIVTRGLTEYVERHALYAQGIGPRVTIRGVMDAAVSRGAWLASGVAEAVLICAAVLAWIRARQTPLRRP
jgi:hypothetical protein